MSRLEDKIKRWEASVDWLKAQMEVMAGELAAAEKREDRRTDQLFDTGVKLVETAREVVDLRARLEAAEKRAEEAEENYHRTQINEQLQMERAIAAEKRADEAEASRERLRAAVHMGGALSRALDRADAFESRLRDAEARVGELEDDMRMIVSFPPDFSSPENFYRAAQTIASSALTLSTLHTRSAAVLAVLDAARAWKKQMQEIIDGDFTIGCPADFLDSWEMDLYEAIRNLDKEVER